MLENKQIVEEYLKKIDIYETMERLSVQHYRTPSEVQFAMNKLDHSDILIVLKERIEWELDKK